MNENSEKFEQLGVKTWLTKQLATLGIENPTPIQEGCIPSILQGKDCMGCAKTGSGKTYTFALPVLQHISDDPYGIFALVLTPTHELAYQIADQFNILGKPLNLRVCIVTGGTDQLCEAQKLASRPHVVVAMPGRLADHIAGCDTFTLKKIKYLIMDEADRLFGESFQEDLKTVFDALPEKRQNLLFSATLTEEVINSKLLSMNKENMCVWKETDNQVTVSTLDQRYVICPAYARDIYLVQVLRTFREQQPNASIIIFTDTKKDCQVLSMTLNAVGMSNVCLHGYMRQKERVAALGRFRSGLARSLVATDVAARGLDVPSVQLVINHKLPLFPPEYIHRVGRTARAGRAGLAISLITPYDVLRLGSIEEKINTKLTEYKVDDNEAVKIFQEVSVTKREQEVKLDNEDFEKRKYEYRRMDWILKGLDPDMMEEGFERMRKKRVKEAKEAKLERIKKYQHELKQSASDQNERRPTNSVMEEESIDNSIKKGLRMVNKQLMKKDDRFKNMIGKVAAVSKKTKKMDVIAGVSKNSKKGLKLKNKIKKNI